MKKLTLTWLALFTVATLNAQVEDDWEKRMKESRENAAQEYESFKQQAMQEYESFRKKANEEYAKFMAEAWKQYPAEPAEEMPWQPKPPEPIIAPETPLPVIAPDNTSDKKPDNAEVKKQEPLFIINTGNPIQAPQLNSPDAYPVSVPTKSGNANVIDANPIQTPQLDSPDAYPVSVPTKGGNINLIPFYMQMRAPQPIERPEPIEPIVPRPMTTAVAAQTIFVFGSEIPFHFEQEQPYKLKDITEKSVAKMWNELSDSKYDNIISECLQKRSERNLCDWAYVRLTQAVSERYFGEGTNEAVVMQMYLLTQSGYQMRIGRTYDNHLALLMGSREKIYRYKFFKIDNTRFYIIDKTFKDKGMAVYDHAFPKEKPLSLYMTQPVLAVDYTYERTISSKGYPEMRVNVETNRNLIDFYSDCPVSAQWNYYSKASLSDVLKRSLYPDLQKFLEGKDELTAVNMLLNFVQTGFEYKTDEDQFGYERPLYPDESFFYPYCDCEDRSILFSCLVRELLGLDVVLLNYPNHISTAVHFHGDVQGDRLIVDDDTYVICDPTYINAHVGRSPSKYKTIEPLIVKL